jgi:hypothetical protein
MNLLRPANFGGKAHAPDFRQDRYDVGASGEMAAAMGRASVESKLCLVRRNKARDVKRRQGEECEQLKKFAIISNPDEHYSQISYY